MQHKLKNYDVVVATYTMFERASGSDDRAEFRRIQWDLLVCDEGHSIKNAASSRKLVFVRGVFTLSRSITSSTRISVQLKLQLPTSNTGTKNLKKLRAECRVILTGTPVQNDLPELLAMLVFLMPKIFDESQHQLVDLFEAARQKERNEEDEEEEREEQKRVLERLVKVRQVLDPFVLRRVKETVLKDLAPKQERVVLLEPTKVQSKLYNATARLASRKIRKSKQSSERALRKVRIHMFTELRKMSNHPLLLRRRYEDTEMLKRLAQELHIAGAFGGDCST
jgi:SWI/SNF-related matrix-associated actin-dependent regulator 1 of chromatin subfamily A